MSFPILRNSRLHFEAVLQTSPGWTEDQGIIVLRSPPLAPAQPGQPPPQPNATQCSYITKAAAVARTGAGVLILANEVDTERITMTIEKQNEAVRYGTTIQSKPACFVSSMCSSMQPDKTHDDNWTKVSQLANTPTFALQQTATHTCMHVLSSTCHTRHALHHGKGGCCRQSSSAPASFLLPQAELSQVEQFYQQAYSGANASEVDIQATIDLSRVFQPEQKVRCSV